MKKAIFGIVVMSFLIISSCSKPPNSTVGIGSWTFKSVTYTATNCTGLSSAGTVNASNLATGNSNISSYGTVFCNFYNNLPTTSGTYIVGFAGYAMAANQIGISVTTGGTGNPNTYESTGGNGSNQTVYVTVSNNGKISLSGSGIEMLNSNVIGDSSTLTITNLTQQ